MNLKTKTKSLTESVFNYYINNNIEESKFDNTILLHEGFEFLKLIDQDIPEIDNKKWINLIVGSTQCGKTFLILAVSNIYLAIGYPAVFIVKDLYQKNQFLTRYKDDSKKLRKYLRKEGFSREEVSIFNDPLYCDSKIARSDKKKFNIKLKSSLDGTKKRNIVCIWNATHLQRIQDNLEVHSKFSMVTDEAHKLGAYKKLSPEYELTGNEKCAYDNAYLNLKVYASKLILLTATPQPILVVEPLLYTNGIVIIPEGVKYRGNESWKFYLIPNERYEVYANTKEFEECKNKKNQVPCSFLNVLAKLSNKKPIKRINKFNNTDLHPINILAKFEVTNEGQHNILDMFKPNSFVINDDHQKIIDKKWTVFVINQEGIRFYSEKLKECQENLKKESKIFKSAKKINECEYLFEKDISIGHLWHWCWKNGGINRFGHIITIAYKSAEEGLTFCSTWNNNPEKDANWHLTHIYSKTGSTIASYSLEQFFGRINGNHGDHMQPPKMYCSLEEKVKVLKSFNLHRKQIRDLCKLNLEHKNERVIEHIHGYEVFDNHVPKEYYGRIKNAKETLKIKHNPHFDEENKAFLEQPYSKHILSIINENESQNVERIQNVEQVEQVDKRKEKIDKIKEIIKSKKNTKNYVLLSNLDIEKEYSREEIEKIAEFAKYKTPKSIFNALTNKKSTYSFGYIFEKVNGNKWRIEEEFKNAWGIVN